MPAHPRRLLRSAAALALATSATGLAYVGSAGPAQAAGYNGYCKTASGVTVVVDFRQLGGGIAIRCAQVGSGATGVQALQAAGIPVQGTSRYGLAFVCRLYGQPAASRTLPGGYHEQCVNTPPDNAHWWYTQAPNGGSWTSSSEGAASSTVIPGGFEGWSFSENGEGDTPRLAPDRPAAQAPPSPTSTSPAPPHRSTPVTTPTATRHPTSHAATSPRASTTASPQRHAIRHPRSATSSPVTPSSRSTSTSTAAADSPSGDTSSGAGGATIADSNRLIKDSGTGPGVGATTVVAGIVLAVLIIGGAAVAIVRRRGLG